MFTDDEYGMLFTECLESLDPEVKYGYGGWVIHQLSKLLELDMGKLVMEGLEEQKQFDMTAVIFGNRSMAIFMRGLKKLGSSIESMK
jgi:hypothetical protein